MRRMKILLSIIIDCLSHMIILCYVQDENYNADLKIFEESTQSFTDNIFCLFGLKHFETFSKHNTLGKCSYFCR